MSLTQRERVGRSIDIQEILKQAKLFWVHLYKVNMDENNTAKQPHGILVCEGGLIPYRVEIPLADVHRGEVSRLVSAAQSQLGNSGGDLETVSAAEEHPRLFYSPGEQRPTFSHMEKESDRPSPASCTSL